MSEDAGFSFDEDTISGNLNIGEGEIFGSVTDILRDAAGAVRDYAQANAPWNDRSGLARSGLDTDVYEESGTVNLVLFHTVDYGLWLEVIQSGRFAIIMPTLEALAPEIFKSVNADMTGIQGES